MNEQSKDIIDKVKLSTIKALTDKVVNAIDESSRELARQPGGYSQ
ncbi:MAG: hypothetical protein RLZZ385_852, partial [Pseudomonadota bacterium]